MSYYEKRIADLEARVAEMARQQRMKAIPVEGKLLERYALMQAENTRLRKAGDELHAFLINYIVDSRISSAYLNKLDDGWLAAKEGKQS